MYEWVVYRLLDIKAAFHKHAHMEVLPFFMLAGCCNGIHYVASGDTKLDSCLEMSVKTHEVRQVNNPFSNLFVV